MGGNAMKQFGIETRRVVKDEYDKIAEIVVTTLW